MTGFPGSFPQAGAPVAVWQEHRTSENRVYYYNPVTQVTQWTKPEEMMTPAERALADQPWKEYTAEGGRKYWFNTETEQSSWEMPEVYKRALGGGDTTPIIPSAPAAMANKQGCDTREGRGSYGGGSGGPPDRPRDYRDRDRDREREYFRDRDRDQREPLGESRQLTMVSNVQAQNFVPASEEPEFASPKEAEAAFVKLLRRSGVQPDWTWEQAVRATVKDSHYRAIRDPKDRKAAFEKFCHDVVAQDKERAKERITKLRSDFATMLRSHPEIKYYTRWETARPMIEGETIFRSTNDEGERRHLFNDYVSDLKKSYKEQQDAMHKKGMEGLVEMMPKLNLEPYTRWSDAQSIIQGSLPFQLEEKYQFLSKYDILTIFQNHIKALERTFNDSRQEEKNRKYRKERKARDGFVSLLQELRQAGTLKAGTKWQTAYPEFESDDRYGAMAGQPGSSPMELFWDVLEEEERALRGTRNDVLDVIDDKRFDVSPKTTFEEFEKIVRDDHRTANIDREILALIFERLQEKNFKRPEDDRLSERQQRRVLDDLRSYMRRVDPPITVTDTYEKVKVRLAKSAEFQAVTAEEARRGAFERHIRRLKEKEEDGDRDRLRRRERERERDRERDRDSCKDKNERPHRSARSARSRTPEPDPYEADRRKAIAERERNFRKTSMAEGLLLDRRSVDPHYEAGRERDRDYDRRDRDRDRDRRRDGDRDRDRDREHRLRDRERDRDRDLDRRSRQDEYNHYSSDRLANEVGRERVHRRHNSEKHVDDLPYGDVRPSSRRRRADEDEIERRDPRDSKRQKIDAPRERTPRRDERSPKKEKSPSVRAGSEEGEIEEG